MAVLPALDTILEDTAWAKIEPSHPQYHLKTLLEFCGITRGDVKLYGARNQDGDRRYAISEIMRPASTTEKWQSLSTTDASTKIQNGIANITQCECNNEDGQARTIALSMAEIAADETQSKTCTLITPDRTLSARVRALLTQWGIQIDDSAGTPLTATPIGRFCLSLTQIINRDILMPVPFLAAMKNKYAGGGNLSPHFRSTLRQFERDYLRGLRPSTDLLGLKQISDKHHDFIDSINDALGPFISILDNDNTLDIWINAHIHMMENIASTNDMDGASRLWIGHEGEALAEFFENLRTFADVTPALSHHDYVAFVETLMQAITTRPPFGTHPRLSILGQIESRMVQADRVILGGLNEGTWPPESGYDAFLSRPMRQDFGLPSLDQKTSLAAHDFATALGSGEVFITYSNRIGGSPVMPSRWIQRMETVLTAANIDKAEWPISRGYQYTAWADELRHMNVIPKPIERPRPKPPTAIRPTEFSITDIEKWMRNPYFIYAKRILNLRQLDPVDMDVTARDKGNLIHDAMEQFTKKFPKQLPDNALDELISIGNTVFKSETHNPEIHGLWWPRFVKAAGWINDFETTWRPQTEFIYAEEECKMTLAVSGRDFVIKGKADRIEKRRGNIWAIVDYKTGTPPPKKDVTLGIASQLPLEAYLLSNKSFPNITPPSDAIFDLQYWSLNGSGDGGAANDANDKKTSTSDLMNDAAMGLNALLSCFNDSDVPYIASPDPEFAIKIDYNDYAHLERISEWSVIEGDD
jgi:ATP-dependent helicase/nuclease subunit B